MPTTARRDRHRPAPRAGAPLLPALLALLPLALAGCPFDTGGDPGRDVPPSDEGPADAAGDLPGDALPPLDGLSGGAWVLGVDPWGKKASLLVLDASATVVRRHLPLSPLASRNLAVVPDAADPRAWVWLEHDDQKGSDLALVDVEGRTRLSVPLAGVQGYPSPRNTVLAACADGSAWAAARACVEGMSPDCLVHVGADGRTLATVPGRDFVSVSADGACNALFLDQGTRTYRSVAPDGTARWTYDDTENALHNVVTGPDGDAWLLMETSAMRGDARTNLLLRRLAGATGARVGNWELWREGGVLYEMEFWRTPTVAPRTADSVWYFSAARKADPDMTHVPVVLSVGAGGALAADWHPENGFVDGGVQAWEPAADGTTWELSGGWGAQHLGADGKILSRVKLLGEGFGDVSSLQDLAVAP